MRFADQIPTPAASVRRLKPHYRRALGRRQWPANAASQRQVCSYQVSAHRMRCGSASRCFRHEAVQQVVVASETVHSRPLQQGKPDRRRRPCRPPMLDFVFRTSMARREPAQWMRASNSKAKAAARLARKSGSQRRRPSTARPRIIGALWPAACPLPTSCIVIQRELTACSTMVFAHRGGFTTQP